VPVHLTPPGDVRPAFDHDAEQVRRLVRDYVGPRAVSKLVPTGSFMLLNKVQAVDAADEVIVGGRTIGVRLFDIYRRRWVFKPDYAGAVLIVEEKLGYYAIARRRLRPGAILERSDLSEYDLPGEHGLYVALSDGRGVYGVGKLLETGAIRVQKTWRARGSVELYARPASMSRVLEVFEERLELLEKDAIEFLEKVRSMGTTMIALSGGKDSTVAAALAVKAGIRRGYFFDTGIEFPETVETAKRVAEALGIELSEISAGDTFWRALRVYGPPGRDYRWCCKVVKFAPLVRGLKPLVSGRLVTVTGQRGFESTQRAQAGRLAPSATTGRHDLLAAPIQEWTSLDVYLYIFREKLPLNPVYTMGYERVGCYLCPTSRLAEIENARRVHPDLWGRWESYLYRFARERGLPREWVVYGFWRWRFSYPAEMIHLARKLGLNPEAMLEKLHTSYAGYSLEFGRETCHVIHLHTVRLSNLRLLQRLLKATGLDSRARIEGDTLTVYDEKLGVTLRFAQGRVEVCGRIDRSRLKQVLGFLRRLLAPVYMAGSCYGCGVCTASCPVGAMVAPHTLEPSKCVSCQLCTYVCPSGGKLSEHALKVFEKAVERTSQL
jgi:phosphoadenosine phosphosulfate reductase